MSGNLSNSTSPTAISYFSYPCAVVYICFFIVNFLLLPLFALILYMGRHQWRNKSSVSRPTISHSDVLTYNIIPMELFCFLGNGCNISFMLNKMEIFLKLSEIFASIGINGQNVIHLTTCVEHYVAVRHPVQYLKSKKPHNIRIRNICIVCFWVSLTFGASITVHYVNMKLFEIYITAIITLGLKFLFVVYCNISILCSLTRPGPGVAQRDTMSVDFKKRRAFYTVTIITGVLLIRFMGSILQLACVLWMKNSFLVQSFVMWSGLPSSLVQPLLFLHRAGKRPFCKTQRSQCST